MVTNKSTAVRLGRTKRWSLQSSSNDLDYYQFSIKFQQLVDTFFSDSMFRDRGIAYSHSGINFSLRSVQVQSFMQDAKISDFIGTFSRRPLFAYHRKYKPQRYGDRFSRGLRKVIFREPSRFTFRKRNIFFKLFRSYVFSPLTLFNRVSHSVYTTRISRVRRFRRYLRFKRSCFVSFYNYFYSQRNFRLRYYIFISKMFSNFFYNTCRSPLTFSFNHIVPRQGTASLYLNYICTKLYYRYILSDVVNPIVRLSLRQYRGFSINCKGRFTRAQIATQKNYRRGALSFSYMKNHLDYAQKAVTLKYGTCNLKLWIRRLKSNMASFNTSNSQRKAIFRVWPKGFKQDFFFKNYFSLAPDALPPFSNYFSNLKTGNRTSRFRAVVVRSKQYGYLSDRAIEAFRKVISPYFRKKSYHKNAFFIHVYPFVPLTKKPAEVRMGGGKGSKLRGNFSPIKPGQIIFSIFMLNPNFSKKLLIYAAQKLGFRVSVFIVLLFYHVVCQQ